MNWIYWLVWGLTVLPCFIFAAISLVDIKTLLGWFEPWTAFTLKRIGLAGGIMTGLIFWAVIHVAYLVIRWLSGASNYFTCQRCGGNFNKNEETQKDLCKRCNER